MGPRRLRAMIERDTASREAAIVYLCLRNAPTVLHASTQTICKQRLHLQQDLITCAIHRQCGL